MSNYSVFGYGLISVMLCLQVLTDCKEVQAPLKKSDSSSCFLSLTGVLPKPMYFDLRERERERERESTILLLLVTYCLSPVGLES